MQGTPYFNFYRGEVEYKAMSAIGYDVGTLGNHEFDNGVEALAAALKFANFELVSANYDVKGPCSKGASSLTSSRRWAGSKSVCLGWASVLWR